VAGQKPFITCDADFGFTATIRGTSEQDSQPRCSNLCQILNLPVVKAEIKTKTERISTMVSEVDEINSHAADRVSGAEHLIRNNRRVHNRYRVQVENYGPPLLLKVLRREPVAACFLFSRTGAQSAGQKLICGSRQCDVGAAA
jgi:hypothetical protein